MKRLIYAVVAASALGLAAGGLALAADNDAQSTGGAVMQSPMQDNEPAATQGAGPADEDTVGQQQDEDKSGDTSKPDSDEQK